MDTYHCPQCGLIRRIRRIGYRNDEPLRFKNITPVEYFVSKSNFGITFFDCSHFVPIETAFYSNDGTLIFIARTREELDEYNNRDLKTFKLHDLVIKAMKERKTIYAKAGDLPVRISPFRVEVLSVRGGYINIVYGYNWVTAELTITREEEN